MISDKERRKVAQELRKLTAPGRIRYAEEFYEELREIVARDLDGSFEGVANSLADLIEPQPIDGSTSDGYHAFNELYHHRRVTHLQEVTADHLRKARTDLHNAREDVEHAERLLRDWAGNETSFERQRTPRHYRGDGLVICSRAMHSAMTQETCRKAEPMPVMAAYWWGCAFKYLWRMWSKADPESDAEKARDCIGKAVRAWSD